MNENLQAAVQQLIKKSLTAMDSATTFLAVVFALPAVAVGCTSINFVWLQIVVAPKVWLIEYAARLIR